MLHFQPTEHPSWDVHMPTSNKLAQICAWTEQHRKMPADAKHLLREGFCRAARAKFVLSANLSEEAGVADLEATQKVLEAAADQNLSRAEQETKQLGGAMGLLTLYHSNLSACELHHSLEALILTPDMICQVHRVLMRGLIHNPGEFRTSRAFGGHAHGVFHYQVPELIPLLLLLVCDHYNQALRDIAASSEQVPALYRLAAVLLVQFATVHPFSDGNGRMAHMLASHVLRSVTPFPVTPYADGTAQTRRVYIDAIMAARSADSTPHSFLQLAAPTELAALLTQAGWEDWRDCVKHLEGQASVEPPSDAYSVQVIRTQPAAA